MVPELCYINLVTLWSCHTVPELHYRNVILLHFFSVDTHVWIISKGIGINKEEEIYPPNKEYTSNHR